MTQLSFIPCAECTPGRTAELAGPRVNHTGCPWFLLLLLGQRACELSSAQSTHPPLLPAFHPLEDGLVQQVEADVQGIPAGLRNAIGQST